MADIFLSYSSSDRSRIMPIVEALQQQGFSVWWDRKIPPGKTFGEVIKEELAATKCVVVLWSQSSVLSDWVETEASQAKTRGILIPALIDDVANDIPMEFSRMQAASFIGWDGDRSNAEFHTLVTAASDIINRGDAPRHATASNNPIRDAKQHEASSTSIVQSPHQPLSPLAYALISLAGLCMSIGLLFFYVYQAKELVQQGVDKQVFYLLLIPWGLSSAAFLFGAMRSYATYTGQHLGKTFELGGPVVIFCLVVLGGFKLVPPNPETFDLTVRPYSEDAPVITNGQITIDLGTVRRMEAIGSNGEANFKGIPEKFRTAIVNVRAQVDDYVDKMEAVTLTGAELRLPLKRKPPPETSISGTVTAPRDKEKFFKTHTVKLMVDGDKGEGVTDEFGRFKFKVSGSDGDRVRLRAYLDDVEVHDEFYILPGPVPILLNVPPSIEVPNTKGGQIQRNKEINQSHAEFT
jgi:hypothetical protein